MGRELRLYELEFARSITRGKVGGRGRRLEDESVETMCVVFSFGVNGCLKALQ
jgi:hypothetical protein